MVIVYGILWPLWCMPSFILICLQSTHTNRITHTHTLSHTGTHTRLKISINCHLHKINIKTAASSNHKHKKINKFQPSEILIKNQLATMEKNNNNNNINKTAEKHAKIVFGKVEKWKSLNLKNENGCARRENSNKFQVKIPEKNTKKKRIN